MLAEATDDLRARVTSMHAPILERVDWIGGRLDDELAEFSIGAVAVSMTGREADPRGA